MKKVLIVEDDQVLVKALKYEFESENFEVFTAGDGEEGLKLCEEKAPSIVLLDLTMPKMDGLTMLQTLRTKEWGKDVPVIVLTNLSNDEKVMHSLSLGAFYYLVKSDWDLADIVAKVKEKVLLL